MPRFYRSRRPGGTFFFTAVTHRRRAVLTTELGRRCFRKGLERIREQRPFDLVAIALLPDHVHTVWTLPEGDADFSTRWQLLKRYFTRAYLAAGGAESEPTASMSRQKQRGLWQRRFWEHTCRDEVDLKRCVDYVHWNPVKHGLVSHVADWPWSTFHRYVKLGEYLSDWGGENPCPDLLVPE